MHVSVYADAAALDQNPNDAYQCEEQTLIDECKTRTDGKTFCCGVLIDTCCDEKAYKNQGKAESAIKKVAG